VSVRIDRVVTSGIFSLDGEDHEVDNNVWLVGDDEEVIVIDAAHDADAIATAVGDRELLVVVCTHGHNDHINAAVELSDLLDAPLALHPADRMLWDAVHPVVEPDIAMADGGAFEVGGVRLEVMHTPGHSPGGVCLYAEELGSVFTGDTLFAGGPGATGRSYSDFETLVNAISETLLALPEDTVVRTGHGESTTIGAEAPHLDEWLARGS